MSETYTDILIYIRDRAGSGEPYPVEVTLSDGSFFVGQVTLDHEALHKAELDEEGYGQLLYKALLAGGPIGRAYDLASGIARARSQGRLRVRLWLDSQAGKLHAIRWERLQHYRGNRSEPISASPGTPFSRYTGLGIAEPLPINTRPLKMLLAISNPSDLETKYGLQPVDVKAELANLRPALKNLVDSEQLKVTILPGQQKLSQKLQEELKEAGYTIEEGLTSRVIIKNRLPRYDIFHFIGHGAFGRRSGKAALYLEKPGGACMPVKDEEIVTWLPASGDGPHLYFLAACESARTQENGSAFTGLALKLVEAGAPAVVAMQDKIAIASAQRLTRHFYEQLLKHGAVDQALNNARRTLYDPKDGNWSIPALYMRLSTGQLFTADPVQAAFEAMRGHEKFNFFSRETGHYLPLPIEVIHLTGDQDYSNLARLEQQPSATIDALQAFRSTMASHKEGASELPKVRPKVRPKVVAFIGGFGSNKSTQLKRMVWETLAAEQPEGTEQIKRRLPIYVDLQGYRVTRSTLKNPLESAVLAALEPFWPDLKASKLSELDRRQPDLRIFFYGLDAIADEDRFIVQEQFETLLGDYPQYEYVLGSRAEALWPGLGEESELHLLVLQPLTQTKIRHFLLSQDKILQDKILASGAVSDPEERKTGANLLDAINQSQLFELVSVPRFMFETWRRAKQGRYPESRTAALQDWVEEAIARAARGQGRRAKTAESIYRLAWEMQVARYEVWPETDAFETLTKVRGNRGYDLEKLFKNLQEGLLDPVGDHSLRFSYLPVQSYCCAKAIVGQMESAGSAGAERRLNDIISMSAAPDRLRWWEDTLIFACGLLAAKNQLAPLTRLLNRIVFTTDLLNGNQLFLAARCLLECQKRKDKLVAHQAHVVTALKWRSRSVNEPLVLNRILATELLSRLADPEVITDLAGLTYEKARRNLGDNEDYEYSSVRMAAAIGLKRMQPPADVAARLEEIQPELVRLFGSWEKADIADLVERYLQIDEQGKKRYGESDDWGIEAIAALATGDLISQSIMSEEMAAENNIPLSHKEDEESPLKTLWDKFSAGDEETPLPVRWAVADALAMVNSAWVTKKVAENAKERSASRPAENHKREWVNQDNCLAYLIGLIRLQEPEAQTFLVDHCLKKSDDARVWITAIDSIGQLANRESRIRLERIASGEFGDRSLAERFGKPSDRTHIRRKALEVLAELGDEESIIALRKAKVDQDEELSETFYWMTSAIYQRAR